MNEFALIEHFFADPAAHEPTPPWLRLGIGDDAALLVEESGWETAITCDTLVEGRHFLAGTDPEALGWKALAVNLSDLAAIGAVPTGFLLALTLPEPDEAWLTAFARGLFACARRHGARLVGGDTTRGPRALTITALGRVPAGEAVLRSGAREGDDVWVSGQPGRAALGLAVRFGELTPNLPGAGEWLAALDRPEPRLALGCRLRRLAHAMLDVSDGLLGDLRHLLERSAPPPLTAEIEVARLPLAPLVAGGAPPERARAALLAGGDDYELLFTAAPASRQRLARLAGELGLALSRIGRIVSTEQPPIVLIEPDGRRTLPEVLGYDHFRACKEYP
ncbi:MAG: thiamine-phosphate kinase [Tepidiphilus sp.]|nr:thiamine-phosphate kinase [Tepidiphilus sp.]MDD3432885.1 thiamine-phosphate kinase [Tepidiphilus sp.]